MMDNQCPQQIYIYKTKREQKKKKTQTIQLIVTLMGSGSSQVLGL